jgi:hydrogenase maturation protease
VGIGNPDSGDDGVGPEVIRRLAGRTRAALFDCRTVPENFTGPIARSRPRTIVLVDAAPTGRAPGAIEIVPPERLGESGFHTHAASPALFLELLSGRTGAACFLIGIEPKSANHGESLSAEAAAASREVADAIAGFLPVEEPS